MLLLKYICLLKDCVFVDRATGCRLDVLEDEWAWFRLNGKRNKGGVGMKWG